MPICRRRSTNGSRDKYEEPIIEELERSGLGEVSGAGTSLGDERPDGTRPIVACGIDIDTDDVIATRTALRTLLPATGDLTVSGGSRGLALVRLLG